MIGRLKNLDNKSLLDSSIDLAICSIKGVIEFLSWALQMPDTKLTVPVQTYMHT